MPHGQTIPDTLTISLSGEEIFPPSNSNKENLPLARSDSPIYISNPNSRRNSALEEKEYLNLAQNWPFYLLAAGASLKATIGMGTFVQQFANVPLFSAAPIVMMSLSEIWGMGFYGPQAKVGLGLWKKLGTSICRSSTKEQQARWHNKIAIVLLSIASAIAQGMSISQARNGDLAGITLGVITGFFCVLIGPGNVVVILKQLGCFNEQEKQISYLNQKELAEPYGKKGFKTFNIIFSSLSTITNILAGASLITTIAEHGGLRPNSALYSKNLMTGIAGFVGLCASAVPMGMNVDGMNKAMHDKNQKGGWCSFFLQGCNFILLGVTAVLISIPSNYTGILGASQTITDFDQFYNNNQLIPIGNMVSSKELPTDPVNISVAASLGLVFACGIAAQTINKGPPTKDLLTRALNSTVATASSFYNAVKNCWSCKKGTAEETQRLLPA